ncbi:MAG: PBP1A family penicillin-binding protein [bacterium]
MSRWSRLSAKASGRRRVLIGAAAVLFLVLVLEAVCLAYVLVLRETPSLDSLFNYEPALVTRICDRHGKTVFTYWHERRRRVFVSVFPDHVKDAFLAAEDADFYTHRGLDYSGIGRAALVNLLRGRVKQGGSTITQQVIRNYYLSQERSLSRKIKEAVMARELEDRMEKDRILGIYLNMVYFGAGAWGVEEAARTYFGVSAKDLDLAQAAMLAGVIQAPTRFCPFNNKKLARKRMTWVLGQMVKQGFISSRDSKRALEEYAGVRRQRRDREVPAPYFIQTVRSRLQDILGEEAYRKGGYKVYTSLDPRTQQEAEYAVKTWLEDLDRRMRGRQVRVESLKPSQKDEFLKEVDRELGDGALGKGKTVHALISGASNKEVKLKVGSRPARVSIWRTPWRNSRDVPVGGVVKCRVRRDGGETLEVELVQEPRLDGALVAIDPVTREVLALVGGYDYERSQFNRATQSKRPPGSAMKPVVYSAAFSTRKYNPTTIIYDRPFTVRHNGYRWRPKNYSRRYYGATSLHKALVKSRNVVTVRLAYKIGLEAIIERTHEMGINQEFPQSLSISLGAYGVSLLDLTNAYAVFASQGFAKKPVFIKRVEDRHGNIIYRSKSPPERVLPEGEAYLMNYILEKVVRDGTAKRARYIGCRSAGKTGTTSDYRDAWYIGYTPRMVVGTWVGKDDYSPMRHGYTGGKAALPMWVRFAKKAFADEPAGWFKKPDDVYYARGTCLLKGTRPDRRKRPSDAEEKRLQKEAEEISELLAKEAEQADKSIASDRFGEEHLKAFLYSDRQKKTGATESPPQETTETEPSTKTGTKSTAEAEENKNTAGEPKEEKRKAEKTSAAASPLPPGVAEDISRAIQKTD